MSTDPLVVEIRRNDFCESTHLVDVAVVDSDGALIASAGDPMLLAAFRSSVKPIQAIASQELGWNPASSQELAVACASHNGEAIHLAQVEAILRGAGLTQDDLGCPAAWPFLAKDIAGAERQMPLFHNCSGKHAGFLAACVASGLELSNYLDPSHELQRLAKAKIEAATRANARAMLVDGCGAPTAVFSLQEIALGFHSVQDTQQAEAMLAHPMLVAGTDRLDTHLLQAGVISKVGAEGLSCATGASPKLGGSQVGIAVKARDGSVRGRSSVMVETLVHLELLSADSIPRDIAYPPVLGQGKPVGRPYVMGSLTLR